MIGHYWQHSSHHGHVVVKTERGKMLTLQRTFQNQKPNFFYRSSSAGRNTLAHNQVSMPPLTSALTRQSKEQKQAGVEGGMRTLRSQDQDLSHGLTTTRVEWGTAQRDLISCLKSQVWEGSENSIRGKGSFRTKGQLGEHKSFLHQVLRDGVEGCLDCYLYTSSDDRSDSWGLESVTYHYSKQGYEIEQAIIGHLA